MKKKLKSFGWNFFYPETLNRLEIFWIAFREFYPVEVLSDDELDEIIPSTFAIFGQSEVYDICSIIWNWKGEYNNSKVDLILIFENFVKTIEDTLGEKSKVFEPKDYITLFLEYVYSIHIKANSNG